MSVRSHLAGTWFVITFRAATAALCLLLLGGCRQRDQIAGTVEDGWERIEQAADTPFAVDPALLSWSELAPIPTGLNQPRGIALGPEGRVYVAGDREVRILNADGSLRSRFEVAGEPRAIAVTDGDSVQVALIDKLLTYSGDGALTGRWDPPGDRNYLTCVAVSGLDVYVADAGERVVHSVSGPVRRFGEKDEARGIPGIICRSACLDVTTTPEGNIVITNPGRFRVETYSPDGAPVAHFGKSSLEIDGFSGCCNPTHLALLPEGRVVTAEKGRPRVKVCNPDGSIESVIALPDDLAPEAVALDLAVDEAGRVLMLDPNAKTVRMFERTEVNAQ